MGYKQKGQDIKSSFSGFKNKTSNGGGGDEDSWSSLFSEIGTTVKNWWNSGEPSQHVNPEIKRTTKEPVKHSNVVYHKDTESSVGQTSTRFQSSSDILNREGRN